MVPARSRDRSSETLPTAELDASSVGAIVGELRAMRASVDERFRVMQHRLDGIDTDLLRLVSLIRAQIEQVKSVGNGPEVHVAATPSDPDNL